VGGGREVVLDTEAVRGELGGGRVNAPAVLCWIERSVEAGLSALHSV